MLLTILALVSLIAINSDIRHRKISNITVLLTGILTAIIALYGPAEQVQLLLPIIIIATGIVLSALNILGAGDTKLLAAYSLGINPDLFPLVLFVITLLGATIGISMMILNRQRLRERGVPYGPAVAIGGCLGVVISNLS